MCGFIPGFDVINHSECDTSSAPSTSEEEFVEGQKQADKEPCDDEESETFSGKRGERELVKYCLLYSASHASSQILIIRSNILYFLFFNFFANNNFSYDGLELFDDVYADFYGTPLCLTRYGRQAVGKKMRLDPDDDYETTAEVVCFLIVI